MAQPQVQVNQPPPQVQVVRPEQPQVQVQPAQPQVLVQRPADGEPKVQVQRSDQQPVVRYERAEPKVVVNQAQGQPQVRIERIDDRRTGAQAASAPAGERQQVAQTASPTAASSTRMLAVSELEDMDVYNAGGNEIGDVENVLIGPNNQIQLVVAYGGFLGIGDRRVVMPLDQFRVQNDRLVVSGRTDEQLKALPAYGDTPPQGYRDAERTYRTAVVLYAPVAIGTATVDPAPATTGAVPPATSATQSRSFAVSALMNREVYNVRGQQLGDVERVLMGEGNKMYVVLGHGGFLGLGEKQILLPMERIQLRDERLVVNGLTDDEIRAMPEFHWNTARGYRELERDARAEVGLFRG
jgi:sporulation protein YlmC with PRC-barrel domain